MHKLDLTSSTSWHQSHPSVRTSSTREAKNGIIIENTPPWNKKQMHDVEREGEQRRGYTSSSRNLRKKHGRLFRFMPDQRPSRLRNHLNAAILLSSAAVLAAPPFSAILSRRKQRCQLF